MSLQTPIIGVDFETSGYCHGHACTPVEIGLTSLSPSGWFDILANSRISGATKISYHSERTHGIRLSDCQGKPRIEAFLNHFERLAPNTPLCAHAAATERNILKRLLPHKSFCWLDTLKLSRKFFPGLPNYQLATVCQSLNLETILQRKFSRGGWHGALFDAAASALIVKELLNQHPEIELDYLLSEEWNKKAPKPRRRRKTEQLCPC